MARAQAVRSGGHAVTEETRDGVPVEVIKVWVERSCAAQGLPVTVTDPAVLRQVGVLLGRSRPPAHLDAVGVEAGPALDGGVDGDVVDEGADDGVLAGDREAVPFIPEHPSVPDVAV
jgi:hypothetical protein